MKTMFLTKTI